MKLLFKKKNNWISFFSCLFFFNFSYTVLASNEYRNWYDSSSSDRISYSRDEEDCSGAIVWARRRACNNGARFACEAVEEIKNQSREMDQAIKQEILDLGELDSQAGAYFYTKSDLDTYRNQQMDFLKPVRDFIGINLRKLMEENFDGGRWHYSCGDYAAPGCSRYGQKKYDELCEDGEDIADALKQPLFQNGRYQASITVTETIEFILANNPSSNTTSNTTGVYLTEEDRQKVLDFDNWNQDYLATIDSYTNLAEDSFEIEFNQCRLGIFGRDRMTLNCSLISLDSSASSTYAMTLPVLLGLYTIKIMLK